MRGANDCVLCGAPYRGRKGLVCAECKRIVKEHKERAASGEGDLCRVELQDRWVYVGGQPDERHVGDLLVALFNGFPEISWCAPIKEVGPSLPIPYGYYDGGKKSRGVPASQANAVASLALAVRRAIDLAHERGITEGRNLLAQLCAGELTSADFERKTGARK